MQHASTRSALPEPRPPSEHARAVSAAPDEVYPKLLLIDWTQIGGGVATGELKAGYFEAWPSQRFAHIFLGPRRRLAFRRGTNVETLDSEARAVIRAREFAPDVVLYRPVADHRTFHSLAMEVIRSLARPYAIWLLDDWPDRTRESDPAGYVSIDRELRDLLKSSSQNFVVSEEMAKAFADRYGTEFDVLTHGVDPEQWINLDPPEPRPELLIRYAGSLAEDTTRASVALVAEAVEALHAELPVRFEIRTQSWWVQSEAPHYQRFKSTTIDEALVGSEYRQWLAAADILVIAYNFDPQTRRYLKYSSAIKVPECLASGRPILLVGPADLSSVALLARSEAAEYVGTDDVAAVLLALRRLALSPERRNSLGSRGRQFAFSALTLKPQRAMFLDRMATMAAKLRELDKMRPVPTVETPALAGVECAANASVQLNEPQFLVQVTHAQTTSGYMVDVGAHIGSSLAPFAKANWQVLAFEPDPENLRRLRASPGGRHPKVEIVAAAVGDHSEDDVPIYASTESSGISGLSPFRESHREVARVRLVKLDEELSARNVAQVDLLKIDVEGHELAVLRGLNFERIKPRVVMVEYEDAKTRVHGYLSHDLASFLVERGYQVYVSEWWPIVRYGVRHSWRRLRPYPCFIPSDGWGNLIGFAESPSASEIEHALQESLQFPGVPEGPPPSTSGERDGTLGSPASSGPDPESGSPTGSEPTGDVASATPPAPSTPELAPFSAWCPKYVIRHVPSVLGAILLVGGLAILSFVYPQWAILFGLLSLLFASGGVWLISFDYGRYLFKRSRALAAAENAKVRADMQAWLHEMAAMAASRFESICARLETAREEVIATLSGRHEELSARLLHELDALRHETANRQATLVAKVETLIAQQADLPPRFEAITSDMERLRAGVAEAEAQRVGLGQAIQEIIRKMEDERKLGLSTREEWNRKGSELSKELTRISQDLTALQSKLAESKEQVKASLGGALETAAKAQASVSALHSRFVRLNSSNAARIRPHQRFIESQELKRMVDYWAPTLGLTATERSLAYLAHQICLMEDRVSGRLATTISAALLRVMALQSLKGDILEVLEIGALFGVSAGILARYGGSDEKRIRLTLIDPLDGYYGQGASDPQTGVPINRLVLERNLHELGVSPSDYRVIQAFSSDPTTVAEAGSRRYDYLLFDGDHSFEGVARDFELYASMIKPHGLLVFDDYDTIDWPEIKKFVDENVMNHPDWEWLGGEWRTAIFRARSGINSATQAKDSHSIPAE